MAYCKKCGNQIADGVKFCPSCGAECTLSPKPNQENTPSPPTVIYVQAPQQQGYVYRVEKSKGIALLLCFFLGGFGAHQFYVGNTTQGVFYLLFSWTCIPELIALVDFFILLCMNESYFHQKYDRNA